MLAVENVFTQIIIIFYENNVKILFSFLKEWKIHV